MRKVMTCRDCGSEWYFKKGSIIGIARHAAYSSFVMGQVDKLMIACPVCDSRDTKKKTSKGVRSLAEIVRKGTGTGTVGIVKSIGTVRDPKSVWGQNWYGC